MNGAFSGNKLFAKAIAQDGVIGVPQPSDWCPLKKTVEAHETARAEAGTMSSQAQDHLEPQKLEEARHDPLLIIQRAGAQGGDARHGILCEAAGGTPLQPSTQRASEPKWPALPVPPPRRPHAGASPPSPLHPGLAGPPGSDASAGSPGGRAGGMQILLASPSQSRNLGWI